jgi:hypothetical protein
MSDNLKRAVNNNDTVIAFRYLTQGSDGWKLKLLEDKPFILELLDLPDSDSVWILFTRLAQHPGMTFNTLLNID